MVAIPSRPVLIRAGVVALAAFLGELGEPFSKFASFVGSLLGLM